MDYDLGYIDPEGKTLQTPRQPFWPKSVTYAAGTFCNLCVRTGQVVVGVVAAPVLFYATEVFSGVRQYPLRLPPFLN